MHSKKLLKNLPMWTTKLLKERFIKFFESRGHVNMPSSSVVPSNDPTLLFTNSGMVQFKNIFLGEKAEHKRVCTSQRCIRAGGKHNDLDDVGKDNYHHTFFEMLGNWSFGDYFKEEAIKFAYEFLVEDLKINKDNLYVTIYEEMDKESKRIWAKYVDESKIIPSSYKDNFWEMGEFGPCGPCTEIHYDRIGNRDASNLVNKDDPNVIEIWNIVFMEYSRTPAGLEPLKIKNIDTGIGLERLLSILMSVDSNYKIDSFKSIIEFTESKCSHKFTDTNSKTDVAFRVIADHARTMSVCIHDGVQFSNEGVGYVLRRILRRAVRYAHDVLGLNVGDLSEIVKFASEFMDFNIDVTVINDEENLFVKTLKKGLIRFNKIVDTKQELDAHDVFQLYDTYGFPKDLTELMAREKDISIDMSGFEELVTKAKEMSRGDRSMLSVNFDFEKTADKFKYTSNGIEAELKAILVNNCVVNDLIEEEKAQLVFDKTCFYSECGGQVGDKGVISFIVDGKEVGSFTVTDTQSQRGYVLHEGFLKGKISKKALLKYDEDLRRKTKANHSTCHILNSFINEFFETEQRGSLVDSEKCRFDFNGNKMSDEMLKDLEKRMNDFIKSNAKVEVKTITKEEALMDKSLHLQDDDYSNGVRIIIMSGNEKTIKDPCGGTHVSNTSEIGEIKIMAETGVKNNIRRMVVCSGDKVKELSSNYQMCLEELKKGKVVNLDVQLGLFDRMEVEALNKENSKALQKKYVSLINSCKKDVSDQILKFKVENMMKSGHFVYEIKGTDEFHKKDVMKAVSTIGSTLETEKVVGIVYAVKDDDVIVALRGSDNSSLLSSLNDKINQASFRLTKDLIQGNLSYSSENMKKIESLFIKA